MTEEILDSSIKTEQTVLVEPKKKSGLKIIVILLIVILLIVGGVYAGMQLEKKKIKVWTEPPFTVEPTTVPDETANWKTYTNRAYSIKYPADWIVEETPGIPASWTTDKLEISKAAIRIFNPASMTEFCGNGGCYDTQVPTEEIYINNILSKETAKQFVDLIDSISNKDSPLYQDFLKGRKTITIGGLTAEVYPNTGEGSTGNNVVISNGTNLTVIQIIDSDNIKKVDQILSTFKFTNQKETKFTCPQNGWVDCMPIMDEEKKLGCSTEAEGWYKANCPNFKGFAQ